jgi:hypothetical protein
MTVPMNRSLFPRSLSPGLHARFGIDYKDYPEEWPMYFEKHTSDRAFEEELTLSGFGYAPVKREGAPIEYDSAREGWVARYVHDNISLAYALTEEALDDNLYDSLSKRYSRLLARSLKHTKEVRGASVLNNAFSTSYLGGDGKALSATDHPLIHGGTYSNRIDADFSEAALETLMIALHSAVDDRGLRIVLKEEALFIPPALIFVAERFFGNEMQTGSADNTINAVKSLGLFSNGVKVGHYLTDPDAWFVKTSAEDGLKYFQRKALRTRSQEDWSTGSLSFGASERYSFGFSQPRAIYASPGV